MFAQRPQPTAHLEDAIDHLLENMTAVSPETAEYAKMMGHLTTLYKLKESNAPKRPSPDTVLLVVGNLVGIVLIIGHERAHVITSKAIGFVLRAR